MAKVKSGLKTSSGEIITPRTAEKLAEEAERGYDLSRARRRRVGRPPLGGKGESSPRISLRITPQLHRAVKQRAKLEGRSISDLAREAISSYVGS